MFKTTDTTGTFEKSDKTAVFTYKKIGKIVPVDPNGNPITGADTQTYKNYTDDPSKVVPNEPTPGVPGYKTDVPKVTPEDPTKDTPVPYTKNETPAAKYGLTEKFVDEAGNELAPSVSKGTDYKTGDKYDVTKDAKVITGYVLVKTTDTTGTFGDSDKTAVFTYKKLGKIVPVDPKGNPIPGADTPTYKNDPDDPSKLVPNEPTPDVPGYKTDVPKVTPEDPTKDTPVPYTKNETPAAKYGLTEKFVDEAGNELAPSESKGTDYKTGDKYDVTKDAKVITGYVLVKTTDMTGTFGDSDKTAVFTYKKLGKIVPVDPNGNPIPGADTPTYKNDPDDPSKVVPIEPTPDLPGYKTDVPNVTPEDPTKDTPVVYTKNEMPSKPSDNSKGAPSAPTGPTSPTLPSGKTAPASPKATGFSTGSSKQPASLKQNAQAKLPQTSEATDKSRALSFIGLSVIALTALFGLTIGKKRKN
ncbi:MAG: MucBP domain-containing protein [Lactobacillus equicursoris]|uniref:MucBP domain-containing protein n=1 Tax=Lactobacillus equicursoris TaxID=420645 RepID=UPI00243275FC|nr:MucBP domain-containing protein [Lactobacillus equicursoris]MDD6407211.1 MucBP domain-containing protein [Lactobacillus equicursoris]